MASYTTFEYTPMSNGTMQTTSDPPSPAAMALPRSTTASIRPITSLIDSR